MLETFKSIEYQGKTVFAKAAFNAFRRMPKYFTADEACFMFVSKGFFSLRTPDKCVAFQEGDGMLAKCGPYFVEQPEQTQGTPLVVLAVYFHPEMVKSFFPGEISLQALGAPTDARNFPVDEMLRIFMHSIDFLLDHPDACSNELVVLKIKELLVLLSKTDKAASVQQFIASLFAPYEYDFRETILKNSVSDLSLPEFARLCNMSLATFKRRFSSVFGESPVQFMTREKMKKAASMLQAKGELRISDIAYDCGYDTVTHFNKVFKKHFGTSPGAFKMRQNDKSVSL